MSDTFIEIEIKLPLHNAEEVEKKLRTQAKLLSENVLQKDAYFIPPHRDFLAVPYPYEWLRLRESSKGTFICYKHFYPENAPITSHCEEFETKVESYDVMQNIFKGLDFKEATVVEKYRTTFVLDDVEVVLDTVTGLGTYIELEAKGSFEDPSQGKAYLHSVLSTLEADVGEECHRGYPYLLLEKAGYTFA